jgi:MFS family permease
VSAAAAPPARGMHPWVTVAYAAWMSALTVGIGIYGFAFFVVPWMHTFDSPRATIMLLVTAGSVTAVFLGPVAGYLLDHYSTKKLVLGSLFLSAAALLATGFATNYLTVIILYGITLQLGIILAGPLAASFMVARAFTENRGLALGFTALGTSVGGLLIPIAVTQLLGHFDWQMVVKLLAAAIFLLAFVPGLLLLRDAPAREGDAGAPHHGGGSLQLMRSRPVLQLGFAYLAMALLFIALLHNIGALAVDLSISQQRAALITAFASIVMAISKVVSGALCDRLNHQLLYAGFAVTIASGLVVVSQSSSFYLLLFGVCLSAAVMGGISPLVASMVIERWGADNFGRVMGVIHAFAAVSGIGPFIAGMIRDSSGSYADAFLWLPLILLPALYCFLTLPEAKSGHAALARVALERIETTDNASPT